MSADMLARLIRLFMRPGEWRSRQAAVFVEQAVPVVQGTQRSLAALTAVFIAGQAATVLSRRVGPPGIPAWAAINLRGVDAKAVYERPFKSVYTALSKGEPLTRAVEIGQSRLREISELDLQQTYAHASRAAMDALPAGTQPNFWRRKPVGTENCAMCLIAATQRYRRENLNPIHPACDCTVEPIFGPDPGQVIDPDLLEQVHTAVEELTGASDRGAREPDYRKLLVQMTAEHGELGTLLVRPLDHFTGPGDV